MKKDNYEIVYYNGNKKNDISQNVSDFLKDNAIKNKL